LCLTLVGGEPRFEIQWHSKNREKRANERLAPWDAKRFLQFPLYYSVSNDTIFDSERHSSSIQWTIDLCHRVTLSGCDEFYFGRDLRPAHLVLNPANVALEEGFSSNSLAAIAEILDSRVP
jgi:hypothetical protein